MSGTSDVIVAAGMQNMSMIPISSAMTLARAAWLQPTRSPGSEEGWRKRYGDVPVSQFNSCEMIAEKWQASRLDMGQFAYNSHMKAIRAQDEGRFNNEEIAPLNGITADEAAPHFPDGKRWRR